MKIVNLLLLVGIVTLVSCGDSIPDVESVDQEMACDSSSQSYKTDIVPILETYCYSCHTDAKCEEKAKGNSLEGYKNLKIKVDEGLVLGNIKHLPGFIAMPHEKEKIPECEVLKIQAWIRAGALEN